MPGTAIIGTVFVDIKGYPDDVYHPTGRNVGTVKLIPGGVSRNVAENFGSLGMPAQFVSSIDRSAVGQDVRRQLAEAGIDTRFITEGENAMGLWLAVFDENGDLAGSISHQPDFTALEALIRAQGDAIVSGCDNIILEIDMNEAIAQRVLELARQYSKKVYVIVGNMGIILKRPDFLRRVDCFICNEIEAGRLFGRNLDAFDPAAMLRFLPDAVDAAGIPSMIVTMGARGAVYYDSRTREIGACPALPCRLIDSTGAGDAFLSGAVMALTRGLSLPLAVRAGTKLASVVIQRVENAAPPMPDFFRAFEDEPS
ncbi:MAG: sugar kinase [Clostridia bacterium]|nr:sugar kinase [Clostridia bacterium]